MMYHRNAGLPAVVVRPANAYGEDQKSGTGQGFIAAAIGAVLNGSDIEIYGVEGTIRDYIHVSDVAAGIVAALDHGEDGEIYNLGTGAGTSNAEIVRMLACLAEHHGMPARSRILPARRFDVEANILDSSKLRNVSSWAPSITLKNGIERMWSAALKQRV
jgi:UDP-glucose 4-epimerase